MPYAPDHKQTTRTRILESARKLFNRHGFDTVSVSYTHLRAHETV